MADASLPERKTRAVYASFAGVCVVLATSVCAYYLHLNLAAAGFTHLFIVLVVALRAGFGPATVTSLVANVCLNFFFVPPVLTFVVNDPENWVALAVFECSALLVSRLSDKAQEQTRRAQQHERELAGLYEVSREFLLLSRLDDCGLRVLASLQRVFSLRSVVLFDSREGRVQGLGSDISMLEHATRDTYLLQRDSHDVDSDTWFHVLRVGGCSMGALALQGASLTLPVASALASLTAITLERAYLFESHSQAEAEKQTEQLRTTVLDALAHEYKTPLTVVRTVTSGMLEMGNLSAQQVELLSLVDMEASRLNEITTKLLQMSRLDKADVTIRRERISLDSLLESINAVAARILSGHPFVTHFEAKNLFVLGDGELLTIALTQFVDNAAKYSDAGSPITLAFQAVSGEVHISVHNYGMEITREDRERVFQRFYRGCASTYRAAGTGLGLWITRRIATIHGGRTWVSSEPNHGNTFTFAMPLN